MRPTWRTNVGPKRTSQGKTRFEVSPACDQFVTLEQPLGRVSQHDSWWEAQMAAAINGRLRRVLIGQSV